MTFGATTRCRFPAAVLALAFPLPGTAIARKLYPVDEAGTRLDFLAFRTRLIEAVRRRDSAFLLKVVDPRIRVSFGDENGIEAFKKQWKPEETSSPLWQDLGDLLSLGGTFGNQGQEADGFWAPYTFSRWPETFDAFEYVAVTREGVTARSRPSSDAPILAWLSYDIVKVGKRDLLVEPHPEGART